MADPTGDTSLEELETVYSGGSRLQPRSTELAKGEQVGRYVVLEEVGRGGMGRVYRAYDPKLRREVALKVLRVMSSAGAAARMLREAQAMAQLSHPNVVPVYDVEQSDDRLFIAMEFVRGDTLRVWMKESRSWQAVAATFMAAGRGLAAAHSAGMIHRDFKPGNVMVGQDGRARVMDFGLARSGDDRASMSMSGLSREDLEELEDLDPSSSMDVLDSALTEAGTVVGTPRYMAPEQHAGKTLTPATDQYAFCVALFEAWFGTAPFSSKDLRELQRQKVKMRFVEHDASRVPKALYADLRRGLAPKAADRWPSMDALLDRLQRDPRQARRRVIAAALVGAGVLGLGGGTWAFDVAAKQGCEREADAIETVWGEHSRQRLRAAMADGRTDYEKTTFDKLVVSLDAYGSSWRAKRLESCVASSGLRSKPPAVTEQADRCFEEGNVALGVLVETLAEPSPEALRHAVMAAGKLPRLDRCVDDSWLSRRPSPPAEADAKAIEDAQRGLTRALIFEELGEYDRGLAAARASTETARAIGWLPLEANANARTGRLLWRTSAYDEALTTLQLAVHQASLSGDMLAAAESQSDLVATLDALDRHDEALAVSGLVELTLDEHGDAPLVRARWLTARGALNFALGRFDEAQADYDETRTIYSDELGDRHPILAGMIANAGSVAYRKGELEEAKRLYEEAVALQRDTLGDQHPDVGVTLGNLASLLDAMGQHDRALELLQTSLQNAEQTQGTESEAVAMVLINLGTTETRLRKHEDARAHLERALGISVQVYGPEHSYVSFIYNNLGMVAAAEGKVDEAAEHYARAVQITEAVNGPEHVELVASLSNLAGAQMALGKLEQAAKLHQRALDILTKNMGEDHLQSVYPLAGLAEVRAKQGNHEAALTMYGKALAIDEKMRPDHVHTAFVLTGIGESELALGNVADATARLSRALEIWEGQDSAEPVEVGNCRFALARATYPTDPVEGLALARAAQTEIVAQGAGFETDLERVEAWIDEHRD